MNINEILRRTSLTGLVSNVEIDEIAEEISEELEMEISEFECTQLPNGTLEDVMTTEWLKDNWEEIKRIYNLNKSGKEILEFLQTRELEKKECCFIADDTKESVKQLKKSNHRRIILVGKAASGKDHMRKILENKGLKYAVSYTTRPPREKEENGKDYMFISAEEFERMISNDEFYEYIKFNDWYYGTSKAQFHKDDVFIMTPSGLSKVLPEDRKNSIVIFFDMTLHVRKKRLMQRNDVDSVERRLIADALDFSNFEDYDIKISNADF